jgi:ribosome maturation factor RimP
MAGNILHQISAVVSDVCNELGVLLYDIEFVKEGKNQVLRVYIDKEPNGIFIDDCENTSKKVSEILDEMDIIKTQYILEVSSPGVERKLKQDWHFKKVIGKDIVVSLYSPLNNKKSLTGKLISYEYTLIIDCLGEIIELEKNKISSAKLHFDILKSIKN